MDSTQIRPRAVADPSGATRAVVDIEEHGGQQAVLVHDSHGRILRIRADLLEQEDAVWKLPCAWAELEARSPAGSGVPETPIPSQGAASQQPEVASREAEVASRESEVRIPIVEEQAHVGTRSVERGRVRIHRKVHEDVETVDVPLVSETARVRRVPVDRWVDEAPEVREEGDELVIPVVEEVLVVEKRLRLREEIRVQRERRVEQSSRRVPLRRTEVEVERVRAEDEDEVPDHE